MYYLCSENKGADQLRGYREADLRLCFPICKSRFSHNAAHIDPLKPHFYMSLVVRNPAFCICRITGADQLCSNCTADQRLCFCYMVQSLYFLNPKFQASSDLLWLYSPVCVRPGRKPRRLVFSRCRSYSKLVKQGFTWISIIFLIFAHNIDCRYSIELRRFQSSHLDFENGSENGTFQKQLEFYHTFVL